MGNWVEICVFATKETGPDPIYLASSLNDWQPNDPAFRLRHDATDGFLKVKFFVSAREIAFKFTKGSWETEEVNRRGQPLANRVWRQGDDPKMVLHIENWKDEAAQIETHLRQISVSVWQEAMWMPTLNRHRKIWVYLPPDYAQSHKRYPVVYMHDAQNLFDEAASPYQKWEVGQTLNWLFEATGWGCIVIGIEHGNEYRLAEYSPFPNPNHGGGEGDVYLQFLIETLKPAVDEQFRTLPQAEHSLMVGSSMGGLISIYAALQYGNVFGKVAAFSPSLWWGHEVYALAAQTPYDFVHKMVLLGGEKESDEMLPDLLAMYYTLTDNGYFEHKIHLDFYQDGTHTESFWGREFEKAIRWLMSDQLPPMPEESVTTFDQETRLLHIHKPFRKAELLNSYGKIIYKITQTESSVIPIPAHWKGLHALKCFLFDQRIEVKKVWL